MGFTLNVHEMKPIGMNRVVIGKSTPYVRIKGGGLDSPPVFLQEGKIYYEDGTEVKDLPEWFADEFKKVSPAMLKNVGMIKEVEDDTPKEVVKSTDDMPSKAEADFPDEAHKRGRGRSKSTGGD